MILDLLNSLLADLTNMNKSVDIVLQLNERSISGHTGHFTFDDVSHAIKSIDIFPRVLGKLLHA